MARKLEALPCSRLRCQSCGEQDRPHAHYYGEPAGVCVGCEIFDLRDDLRWQAGHWDDYRPDEIEGVERTIKARLAELYDTRIVLRTRGEY